LLLFLDFDGLKRLFAFLFSDQKAILIKNYSQINNIQDEIKELSLDILMREGLEIELKCIIYVILTPTFWAFPPKLFSMRDGAKSDQQKLTFFKPFY